jgi:hypothetical protein
MTAGYFYSKPLMGNDTIEVTLPGTTYNNKIIADPSFNDDEVGYLVF